jgi:hypothetical protein
MNARPWLIVVSVIVIGAFGVLGFLLYSTNKTVTEHEGDLREVRRVLDQTTQQVRRLKQIGKRNGRVDLDPLLESISNLRDYARDLNDQIEELRATVSTPTIPNRISCGDLATEGAGVYKVQALGVPCEEAIRVAGDWPDGPGPPWSCESDRVGYEVSEISCESESGGLVTFESGS